MYVIYIIYIIYNVYYNIYNVIQIYFINIYTCNINVKMEICVKRGKSKEIRSNNAKKVK